ncbi:MAG: IPT/TIG domain-containing protein [Gemmatimonadetes bacterium]|nr:IPT/TIG domain-containing protein [Gemmatimonadota bacterium]
MTSGSCSADFDDGTAVTLTANPAAGSAFVAWSDDCTGGGTCNLTMDADKDATAQLQLAVQGSPTISSISPSPLVEGASATISGTGFSAVASNNTVLVDGAAATVNSATETMLEVTLPIFDCRPGRSVDVQVAVAGLSGSPVPRALMPKEAIVQMGIGEQQILQNPTDFCLQFEDSVADEAYLVGIQSVSEVASALTPVQVTSVSSGKLAASLVPSGVQAERSLVKGGQQVPLIAPRWRRHRRAEARLREQERRILSDIRHDALVRSAPLRANISAAVPPVSVGDVIQMRVPDLSGENFCLDFITVNAEVRTIGTRGIWLEDQANPTGGYSQADYDALSDRLDNQIYQVDVDFFGEPTDIDGNGRVVILITQEVNKPEDAPLAFVFPGDLFPQLDCPSSDVGEVFYSRAPDPNGTVTLSGPYTLAEAIEDAPLLLVHEIAHIIQNRRLFTFASFMAVWMLEGQAFIAEEELGHRVEGRSAGQNLGADVLFNSAGADERTWYLRLFGSLVSYFGFGVDPMDEVIRVRGAPHECGWLGRESSEPCMGSLVNGVAWSLIRWADDHFSGSFPGGSPGFQQALIDNAAVGFANLEGRTGQSIETMLAQWAATLFVDDRIAGLAENLTFPSWNLFDVDQSVIEQAQLLPTGRGFGDFQSALFTVAAASSAYFRFSGGPRQNTAVRFRGSADEVLRTDMQLWIVRLR